MGEPWRSRRCCARTLSPGEADLGQRFLPDSGQDAYLPVECQSRRSARFAASRPASNAERAAAWRRPAQRQSPTRSGGLADIVTWLLGAATRQPLGITRALMRRISRTPRLTPTGQGTASCPLSAGTAGPDPRHRDSVRAQQRLDLPRLHPLRVISGVRRQRTTQRARAPFRPQMASTSSGGSTLGYPAVSDLSGPTPTSARPLNSSTPAPVHRRTSRRVGPVAQFRGPPSRPNPDDSNGSRGIALSRRLTRITAFRAGLQHRHHTEWRCAHVGDFEHAEQIGKSDAGQLARRRVRGAAIARRPPSVCPPADQSAHQPPLSGRHQQLGPDGPRCNSE